MEYCRSFRKTKRHHIKFKKTTLTYKKINAIYISLSGTVSQDRTSNQVGPMLKHYPFPISHNLLSALSSAYFLCSLYCKQYEHRSDSSLWSCLIMVHIVYFHEVHLNICSRRKNGLGRQNTVDISGKRWARHGCIYLRRYCQKLLNLVVCCSKFV